MDEMIAGTPVFTGERAHAGYRLNRMAMSLTDAANRRKFVADELGYARETADGVTITHLGRALLASRCPDWPAGSLHG